MIDLDTTDIEKLNLSERSKSLLKETISRFKDLIKSTDDLIVDEIKFYIETEPDKFNNLYHLFHLTAGYGIDYSSIKIFKELTKPFNGFIELKIKLSVSRENENSEVGGRSIGHLEKYVLLPILE
jgi:hypothetical protein